MEYLENGNLLSDVQFGYRSNRLTSSASVILVDDIPREIDNGKLTGTVFLDLTKAFNTKKPRGVTFFPNMEIWTKIWVNYKTIGCTFAIFRRENQILWFK